MKNITDYRNFSPCELFIMGLVLGVIAFVFIHEFYDLYKAYDFEYLNNVGL